MRGRFAPSPTGALHLGNVRTAMLTWLQARAAGGAFVLRIEDIDPQRTLPHGAQDIIRDLRWLGFDWDEGPDLGGPHAPYVQSATWNGANWNNAYLPPSAVSSGGTLNLTLDTTANTSWATAASSAPPSYPGSGGSGPAGGPITSAIAGKCVDVRTSGGTNGTPIQIYGCNGTNAQKWTVPGDGTLRAFGKCMDVDHSGTADGTKVQLWDCNGTGAQQWTYNASAKSLTNPESGKCLDDPNSSTADSTQLQIYTCNGTNAQQWTLPS